VRENGGQYTHAAVWSVMAFASLREGDKAAALFSLLNPINDARTRTDVHRYKVEPYVVAAIEAIGLLGWPAGRLKILSIGTLNEPCVPPRWKGKLSMAASVTRLFMAGQSHSALGTAKIVTGDVHDRKAIWRIDQTAPKGRYSLDNVARISEMKDRAFAEAREQLPELRWHLFGAPGAAFEPFHRL